MNFIFSVSFRTYLNSTLLDLTEFSDPSEFFIIDLDDKPDALTLSKAFDKVSASGLSSRSIIKNSDGSENSVKSRRVEFRYVLNETEKIKFIKSKLKNNGKN